VEYHELKLLDKPERIWNLNETSFCLDASKTRVVGAKNVAETRVTQGSGRQKYFCSHPSYTSFEELLFSSMKQIGIQKTSKRKVTSIASVITYEEAIQMLREKDNEKKKPK